MLASDILCIVFLSVAMLIIIYTLGALINYWWKHRRITVLTYITFGIVSMVLIAIFIGAIISIVVVF